MFPNQTFDSLHRTVDLFSQWVIGVSTSREQNSVFLANLRLGAGRLVGALPKALNVHGDGDVEIDHGVDERTPEFRHVAAPEHLRLKHVGREVTGYFRNGL